jgi:hypothetical protein
VVFVAVAAIIFEGERTKEITPVPVALNVTSAILIAVRVATALP